MSYNIRTATREEIDYLIEWAASEGWNPGLHDANCFYKTDPNGFFIGEYKGKIVGGISAVAYDKSFGFIGFFIVQQKHRNSSLGPMLALKAIKRLSSQNIGLDGVFDKMDSYANMGFIFAYRNLRFESKIQGMLSENVIPVSDIPFSQILEYDTRFFPTKREIFLKEWLTLPESKAYAIKSGEDIQGYGMIRKCRKGYKIGPLFAENDSIAEELLLSLASESHADYLYFDIPEINKGGIALAKKYNMEECFGTARMYSKEIPELPVEKIYGVTSFELG